MSNEPTTPSLKASRRELLRAATAIGAAAAVVPVAGSLGAGPAQAQTAPASRPAAATLSVNTRVIGRTNETVTALGLGTFLTFDLLPGQKRDHLRDVTRTYVEAGVRVLDTSPLYGTGEASVGAFIAELGVTDQLFIANKIWSTGDYLADESHALRSLEQSQLRLWRERFDLMQCHSLVNVDVALPIMQAWKKEGRTRLVGATHHENTYHPILAGLIERGSVDFVQVNYSIFNRGAEERILPAAADKGVGVLINMALEKARLTKVVEGRPLPDFAREIGAENWPQFFLKWVMGHPAVTTVLTATSNPAHAQQNVGALRGRLPDAAMRTRMVQHMETIPGFSGIASMPWYPDKQAMYPGVIRRSQGQLRKRLS